MKIKYTVIALAAIVQLQARAQSPGWQHLDMRTDSVLGISTTKAYGLLKGKVSKQVIVAVIDDGIDTAHEDLKSILWRNPRETRGNNKDDDKNHFTDDFYGWSFLGSKKGNLDYENSELTRLYREGKKKFGNGSLPSDTTGLADFKSITRLYQHELTLSKQRYAYANGFKLVTDTILLGIGKNNPSIEELKKYIPLTLQQAQIKKSLINNYKEYGSVGAYLAKEWEPRISQMRLALDYNYNIDFEPRSIVGDKITDPNERYYGSADVMSADPGHGTHVAGIIAATRNNGIGIDGVADNVKIMMIRAVPKGDERDKDIANAIRYAVDNGAGVINMSFGKPYSPDKKVVDEAVKYAMEKDVLLVHAAGNESLNIDIEPHYPSDNYKDGSPEAKAWIEVGATDARDNEKLVAPFSNYGKRTVDVFAPGVKIMSTVPGNGYLEHDGTSMAAPVVAGLAALIREYYPGLTAVQVKEIIMRSAVRVDHDVSVGGRKVPFSQLSVSGGIVNAYEAIKLAETFKPASR